MAEYERRLKNLSKHSVRASAGEVLVVLKDTYLNGHHDDEAILNDLIVSYSLGLILHDLTIGNELLGLSCLAMSLGNEGLQSRNL